jgi:hypothetical protein
MSNMRSGSTWLITTLGTLPDSATEYEVKWKVDYQPQPIHCVLNENSPTVAEIFDGFNHQAPIVGSKFVFVSYERLHQRLADVVKFIGGTAPPELIAQLMQNSVTLKLPEAPAEQIVHNVAEVDPLFQQFEQMRLTCWETPLPRSTARARAIGLPAISRSAAGPEPKPRRRKRCLRLRQTP